MPNHCCRGKAGSITYSQCVFAALGIQHKMRVRHLILPSVWCLSVPHFSTLSYKRTTFVKTLFSMKVVFLFSLQLLSETFLILRRTERDMIKHVYWFDVILTLHRR